MQGESKCVSVHLPVSTTKWNNFRPHGQIKTKFSGSTQAFERNFWVGGLNPGTLGIRTRPQKGLFRQIYLLPWFWGRGIVWCLLETGGQFEKMKFDFSPRPEKMGPEGRAGQGANHNFGVSFFFIKVTPTNFSCRWLSNFCSFLFDAPRGGPQFFLKKDWNLGVFQKY